jgi:TatD DNase family protein
MPLDPRPLPRPDGAPDPADAPLVDIGVNLADSVFSGDLDAILERARMHGIRRQLVTGTDLAQARAAVDLARRHPGELFATSGIHPHHAAEVGGDWLGELAALARHSEVRALGETGLDFNRDFSPRPVQEQVFEAQLELAADTGLPLFLHERDTGSRFLEVLHPWRDRVHGVLHCFTGSRDTLFGALDAGMHIGITGWVCDERRGGPLREQIPGIPAERLLLETDAPWLLPRTVRPRRRSRRNEPGLLPWVLMEVARLRGDDPGELARRTTDNACTLFDLPPVD